MHSTLLTTIEQSVPLFTFMILGYYTRENNVTFCHISSHGLMALYIELEHISPQHTTTISTTMKTSSAACVIYTYY